MALHNKQDDEFLTSFRTGMQQELEATRRQLKEINQTLTQSQSEIIRLTQKKATVTTQLQQLQSSGSSFSVVELRNIYNEALDSQQRLLVVRGQVEKLTTEKAGLERYQGLLERVIAYAKDSEQHTGNIRGAGQASLEMLIRAQEAERLHLSRQMHDGPAQALSNFIVQAEIATRLFEIEPSKAKDELDKLKNSAMRTFQKVRTFITDIRPMSLDDLGLVPTVRKFVESIKEQSGLEVTLNLQGAERRLEKYLEVFIFRAIQECVNNSVTYNTDNNAKVKIDIQLEIASNQVKVVVIDNGKGFDPGSLDEASGLGLKLIQERTQMLGGLFDLISEEGKGCQVSLQIPVSESAVIN